MILCDGGKLGRQLPEQALRAIEQSTPPGRPVFQEQRGQIVGDPGELPSGSRKRIGAFERGVEQLERALECRFGLRGMRPEAFWSIPRLLRYRASRVRYSGRSPYCRTSVFLNLERVLVGSLSSARIVPCRARSAPNW